MSEMWPLDLECLSEGPLPERTMIEIAEERFIGDIGQALSEFGTDWEFMNDVDDAISPVGEQLYAQMMGWT